MTAAGCRRFDDIAGGAGGRRAEAAGGGKSMMDKLKSRISSGADISVDGRSGWGIHALFNAVIEIGFLLFVVLMIVNHASVNAPRLYAAAAAIAILVSAMAVGGSKTWSAGVYKAMTAFVFLLIYASARESGILIGLSENRAMAVSVAGITLCVVGVIFSAKLMTAGILGCSP